MKIIARSRRNKTTILASNDNIRYQLIKISKMSATA